MSRERRYAEEMRDSKLTSDQRCGNCEEVTEHYENRHPDGQKFLTCTICGYDNKKLSREE